MSQITDTSLRRLAYRRGLKVIKYNPTNRWYSTLGPYSFCDWESNIIHISGLTREEVEEQIRSFPLTNKGL